MSYQATAYNVMIASPGDVAAERAIIREVLAEWNAVNARSRGIVLLPVGWETHASPEMGDRAQAIINKQVLQGCDLLVGVFWTRIGTATGQHASGTVEEIEEHMKAGKPAMLYFAHRPVDPDSVDREQYDKLKAFRGSCLDRGLCEQYSDLAEFKEKLYRHLQLTLNKQPFDASGLTAESTLNAPTDFIQAIGRLSHEAQVLVKAMSQDKHGQLVNVQMLSGRTIQTDQRVIFERGGPREEASWLAGIRELEDSELIEPTSAKREIFRLTSPGYEAADILTSQNEG